MTSVRALHASWFRGVLLGAALFAAFDALFAFQLWRFAFFAMASIILFLCFAHLIGGVLVQEKPKGKDQTNGR